MGPSVIRRGVIVGLYFIIFWFLLPALLFKAATTIDGAFQWQPRPMAIGWPILALGAAFLLWGMAELWRGGRGLPVSALPPPRFTRHGPYRWVRHPIYFGFNVGLFGAGLVLGSFSLTLIVAPLFFPLWALYATIEERGLIRRFPGQYSRYRSQVGLLPQPALYRLLQLVMKLGAIPYRIEGKQHIPRRGGVVLVANHTCYIDALFVGHITWRTVRYLTTAEAHREGWMQWFMARFVSVPVRRYRPDPISCREMLRLLAEGEVVCLFVERERSILGNYQGCRPEVARILPRLPFPIIPLAVTGGYDIGPRWASTIRRGSVSVRAGPPLNLSRGDTAKIVDQAIKSLLVHDPQPVRLAGLDLSRLQKALWRCPRCLDEDPWQPDQLRCRCGARWTGTANGWLTDESGHETSLADLARRVWEAPELELSRHVAVWRERSWFGPIVPLEFVVETELAIDRSGLRFDQHHIAIAQVRSTSTERADTLQIATATEMWQFRLTKESPFRLQRLVDRLRHLAREDA